MKWSELTWKERKQIYDAVRADNPNASYLDIKQQFDNIPEYEDGKSRWLTDAAYRDSIHTARLKYHADSDARRKNFKSSSLEEIQNSDFIRKDSTNNKPIFKDLSYLNQLLLPNIPTSNQIENAIDAQKEERVKRVKPLKDFAKISGVLGQMALSGGAIAAKNAGNLMLSQVLQGTAALWDGVETIQAINDDDNLGIIQNAIPVISQGVAGLKYLPKLRHTNSIILDGASNLGPIWDFSVNPIMEYLKTEENANKYNSPAFENGKEGNPKLPVELGLTPGTPEYFARQQRISGRADAVQPEAHLTPAGLVKDAISFGENIKEGNAMNKVQYNMYRDKSRFVDRMNHLIPVEYAVPLGISGFTYYNTDNNN